MTTKPLPSIVALFAFAVGCSQSKPPGETYLAYHTAAVNAKSADDLRPFLTNAERDKLASAPAEAKQFIFELRQEMEKRCVGAPKVLKEDVQGDKAVLRLEAVLDYTATNPNLGQKPATATIDLVKESDGWKVTTPPNWQMK